MAVTSVIAAGFFASREHVDTRRLNADLFDALGCEERHRDRLTRANHMTRLRIASDLFAAGNSEDVAEHVRLLRPEPTEPDYRGFVWHYLDGQTRPKRALRGHHGIVWGESVAPDGRTVASLGADRSVRLWDIETGNPLAVRQTELPLLSHTAFRPDGAQLAIASDKPDGADPVRVRVYDRAGQVVAERVETIKHLRAIEWTADGHQLYLAEEDTDGRGLLTAWTSSTGTTVALPADPDRLIHALKRSPDGRTFAATVATAGAVCRADVIVFPTDCPESAKAANLNYPHAFISIDFSPDGTWVVAATVEGCVWMANATTLLQEWRQQIRNEPVITAVRWTDDARSIAMTWANGHVDEQVILDAATGRQLPERREVGVRLNALARDPALRTVVSAGGDGLVRVRTALVPLADQLLGHTGQVWSVAFSPDSRTLASASDDNSIRLWDVTTRTERAVLNGHESLVMAVVFSPDGRV